MNSATIQIRPESPRTLVPITVDLSGSAPDSSRITVRGPDGKDFQVETAPGPDGHVRGVFWLERPGDYTAAATTAGQTLIRPFRVSEQVFLPFSLEFGIFSIALLLAGGGLILWFRNRKKAGSSSASSPS